MDIREIQETPIWSLYEKGRNYHRQTGVYTDTDRNYRFYNGDQWDGAKLGGVEPVQKNFIKPIVKYKCAVIHDHLYAMVFSSMNFANRKFRPAAERYCKMLNGYAEKIWELDKMDFKGRRIAKDAAINDEGILYISYDTEKKKPVNEIIKKNDIYYGNENDDDIQSQPYILIRKRLPVVNAIELAHELGVTDKDGFIRGDNDTMEESGDAAKLELDDMVTVIYKMYKLKGTVHFSVATRLVTLVEDKDIGIELYPVAHFVWEEKEGSARGEGEVRRLIPNQIEVNKTEMRRVLTVKEQAYPQRVVDAQKVSNPDAVGRVGATIRTQGNTVEDVNKVVGIVPPASISNDVVELQQGLINASRELAGAGDTATGNVDPEAASGRAILAVQQASRAPVTEQKESYKNFIEDIANIWLAYFVAYSDGGIEMEEEVTDPTTGKKVIQTVKVPQSALKEMQARVKIDVTPRSVYDRFALERTLENLLMNGLLSVQRLPELEVFVKALPDDAVTPKHILEDIVKEARENQKRIAQMKANAQLMQQRGHQFMYGDPEAQGAMLAEAERQLMAQEQQYAQQEAALDEQVEVPAESEG